MPLGLKTLQRHSVLRPGNRRQARQRNLRRAHHAILQRDGNFRDRRAAILGPAREQRDGEFRTIQGAPLDQAGPREGIDRRIRIGHGKRARKRRLKRGIKPRRKPEARIQIPPGQAQLPHIQLAI